jgi:hypothetical protein
MHVPALLALLLSTLSTASTSSTAGPTSAKPEATTPRIAAAEIVLEVVEQRADKPSSFGFVVPVEGIVEAWIDRGDDPRRCEVEVDEVGDALRVKLHCDGSPDRSLRVEARRKLVPGKRTRIAEVTRPGGTKRQVFVTLQ